MFLQLLEKEVQWISVPESLLYALIGFLVVFLGIAVLIFFVWLMGKIMGWIDRRKETKKNADVLSEGETPVTPERDEGDLSEEVKIAIAAAIAAYYEGENSSCEFRVKRIRRI